MNINARVLLGREFPFEEAFFMELKKKKKILNKKSTVVHPF